MRMRTPSVILGALVIIGLIIGGVFLFKQGKSIAGLSIDFAIPDEVLVGEPFILAVNIGNNSDHVLQGARLSIDLPSGMAFVGSSEEKIFTSKILGDIGVGSLTKEDFELIALGGSNTVRTVKATVTYSTASLQTQFEKEASTDIAIQGESVSFDLAMPEKVLSGETFKVKLTYKNIGTMDLEGLELILKLPPSYAFSSAVPKPDNGNNIWQLGTLHKGSEGTVELQGSIIGPDNAFFEIGAELNAEFAGRSYLVGEKTGSLVLEPSPISVQLTLNGGQDAILLPGSSASYKISFANNTDIGFKDVVVRAQLVGEMFDMPTVASNASLKASDNTLIWNAANTPGLDLLKPGESKTVNFSIALKKQYPIKKLSDKNFTLKVNASVESPTTPYNVATQKTVTVAKLETKIGGQVVIDAKGLFRDASSGILNKGPWPMKAGQTTQFTIHWVITNYATDISDIKIRAFLGGNVKLVGTPKSNIGSIPKYNENTQELIWDIPDIVATKGIVGAPVEAIFQVEAAPSVADVNHAMELIQSTTLEANDDFTGQSLSSKDTPVLTNNLDDPTVTTTEGIVQQ